MTTVTDSLIDANRGLIENLVHKHSEAWEADRQKVCRRFENKPRPEQSIVLARLAVAIAHKTRKLVDDVIVDTHRCSCLRS